MKVFATGLTALLAMSSPLLAQTTMELADEYPAGTIHADVADYFIEQLKKDSDGAIIVTAHHGGALGYKSVDQFDAVGDGAVQVATSYFGAWSGIDPIFLASSLPFLATSLKDTRVLYDATRPYYEKALAANNQVFLYATPWPASGLWAHKPVKTVEDLAGLKIRASDALGVETLTNAGANPVQLSWSDVVPQLTTNGIDGVLTSADGGVASQFWEYLKGFTEINYALPLQGTHMNKNTYDGLDEAQQAAVQKAAKAAEAYGWDLVVKRRAANYATLEKNGVTVTTDLTPELTSKFKSASTPVIEGWAAKVGPDAEALLKSYNAAIAK